MSTVRPLASYSGVVKEIPDTDQLPAALIPASGSSPFTEYAATLTDCVSTTGLVDVLSGSIPANDWADGDIIEIMMYAQVLNSGGQAASMYLYYGSDAYTIYASSAIYPQSNATIVPVKLKLARIGSTIYISFGDGIGKNASSNSTVFAVTSLSTIFENVVVGEGSWDGTNDGYWVGSRSSNAGGKLTSIDFTSTKTLKISASFNSSSASRYVKPKVGKILRY
ncbi:MAG: hypothetical protein ABI778_08105 [Ignavibacteriota bacterium]